MCVCVCVSSSISIYSGEKSVMNWPGWLTARWDSLHPRLAIETGLPRFGVSFFASITILRGVALRPSLTELGLQPEMRKRVLYYAVLPRRVG